MPHKPRANQGGKEMLSFLLNLMVEAQNLASSLLLQNKLKPTSLFTKKSSFGGYMLEELFQSNGEGESAGFLGFLK